MGFLISKVNATSIFTTTKDAAMGFDLFQTNYIKTQRGTGGLVRSFPLHHEGLREHLGEGEGGINVSLSCFVWSED